MYLSLLCCSLYFSDFIVISLYSSSHEKGLFSSDIYSSLSYFSLGSRAGLIELVYLLWCLILRSCDSSSAGCGVVEGPGSLSLQIYFSPRVVELLQ